MDIIVEGIGKKFYKPDEVEISLDFYTKEKTYEKALENGTKDVEFFITEVLGSLNIDKELMKTRNFRIYEETKYDYNKKIYYKLGFAYTQHADLKLDYSIDTIAAFMNNVSKLKNPPKYQLMFNVKDLKGSKDEVIQEAYNNAKEKAEIIAKAAGKELKDCIKTDFKPFEEKVISRSELRSDDFNMMNSLSEQVDGAVLRSKATAGVQEALTTIFTPEDVEISEKLYCLWVTN